MRSFDAVRCTKFANDGLLHACDRGNNRVQVFKAAEAGKPCAIPDGEAGKCGFVGEIHVAPQSIGGTSGTVNFSTRPKQNCMYVADLVNDVIYVMNRQNLTELTRIGGGSRQAGRFHWPHVAAEMSDYNGHFGESPCGACADVFALRGCRPHRNRKCESRQLFATKIGRIQSLY